MLENELRWKKKDFYFIFSLQTAAELLPLLEVWEGDLSPHEKTIKNNEV